ncbi:MAG: PAS domain S-box protein [Phycisphaerae bacterium]
MAANAGGPAAPSPSGDAGPVNDFGNGLLRGDPTCCALADTVPDGIYVLDTAGRFRFVNRAIEARSGMPRERFYEVTYLDLVLPQDHATVRDNFERVMAGEGAPPYVLDYAVDDGTLAVEVNCRPIRAGGEVVGLLGVSRDITARRRAEEGFRESRRFLLAVFDGIQDGISVRDRDLTVLRVNRWMEEKFADRMPLVGKKCYRVFQRRETPCPWCAALPAMETGEVRRCVVPYPSEADPRGQFEITAFPLTDEAGEVVGAIEHIRDITDRWHAEQALRRSEETYRALVQASPDAVAAADLDYRLIAASDQAYRMFGYAKTDEVLGRSVVEFYHPEDVPRMKENFEVTLRRGLTRNIEYTLARKDGSTFVGEVSAAVLRHPDGEARGLIATLRDVTDRRRAEEALRQSEANYRAIFNAVHDMVFVHDIETGDVVDMNRRASEAYGYGPDDLDALNAHFRRRDDSPYGYAEQMAWLRRAAEDGPQLIEWLAEDRRGRRFWVEVGVRRATIGGTDRLLAVLRDISDRKQAEEALRESEARYRAVLESQTELVCRFRPDHTLTFVNEAYARYFGQAPADLVGRQYAPLIVEEDRDRVRRELERIGPDHPVVAVEERVLRPDGEVRWQHWTARGIFDEAGRLVELQGVGRDVTDRKQAEEALRRSEEDYRLLFEQSLDGIVVVADGRIVRANEAFARIHACAVEDLLGTPSTDLLHPDERATAAERIRGILDGALERPGSRQYHALRADGSVALVEYRSRRILWEGRPAVQAIVRDVTEQVRLQEQLQQALKMEAVGQLAGGIAHDFNNLMTGILCHAGLLKSEADAPGAVRETADLIEGAARRAAGLTSQLLGFARRGKQQDVPVDLVDTVETSMRLLSQSLPPRVTVRTEFQAPAAYVRGDPVQMEQVVLNLAMNARDAMPEGGTVTFAVEQREVSEADCESHAHARPGRYTVLTVADTGVGIPKEQHSRVFEPFFTTKPQGKGTGMGLAMVYGIVRNHGGWIDVASAPGEGTTFRVFMPALEPLPEDEAPPAAPAAATAADRARILVVDDEELVRDVLSRMLERLGHEAVAVASGQEAVDYYRDAGDDVAAVIIDFSMPGMDGRECFRTLKRIDPDVRVVLATGGGAQESMQDLLDEGLAALVKKPFEIGGLETTLRRVLGA